MKLKHLLLLVACVLLSSSTIEANEHVDRLSLSASTTSAQTEVRRPETKNLPDLQRGNLKEARENLKNELKDKKEEVKTTAQRAVGEIRSEVALQKARMTSKILTATLTRLQTLAGRIDSRVTKLKSLGGNTSEAETSLAAAKADLSTARTHIQTISSLEQSLASSTASTTLRTNFESIKTEAKTVRESLAKAHKGLEKTVQTLRDVEKSLNLKIRGDLNASTTKATTTKEEVRR